MKNKIIKPKNKSFNEWWNCNKLFNIWWDYIKVFPKKSGDGMRYEIVVKNNIETLLQYRIVNGKYRKFPYTKDISRNHFFVSITEFFPNGEKATLDYKKNISNFKGLINFANEHSLTLKGKYFTLAEVTELGNFMMKKI